jgi:hypothetical protein
MTVGIVRVAARAAGIAALLTRSYVDIEADELCGERG